MGTEDHGDLGFQHGGGDSVLNCSSSGMNTSALSEKVAGITMSSGPLFKSSNGAESFFGSGWDSLVSLGQSDSLIGSSMIPHSEFSNAPYPVVLENQTTSTASHLVHYPSDSGIVEMVPELPCFGSGNLSEMVGSFGVRECGQITGGGCRSNYPPNKEDSTEKTSANGKHSQEDCPISEEEAKGASPGGMRKRKASESHSPFSPSKNTEGEQQKDPSGDSSEYLKEQDEKKQKYEQNVNANLRGKQICKQGKYNSNSGTAPKENYIHVRARRGQATNSHSLAERVRRERISERMRLLQELVPGCNKITGKAVMLDEIINYVQSLQQQVEFLSMKLATVNPELDIDIERILSKDTLHSRGSNPAILGFSPGLSSSNIFSQGIPQGTLPGISSTTPFHPMTQTIWDNELQSLLPIGFDSNPTINNLEPNGRSKLEL